MLQSHIDQVYYYHNTPTSRAWYSYSHYILIEHSFWNPQIDRSSKTNHQFHQNPKGLRPKNSFWLIFFQELYTWTNSINSVNQHCIWDLWDVSHTSQSTLTVDIRLNLICNVQQVKNISHAYREIEINFINCLSVIDHISKFEYSWEMELWLKHKLQCNFVMGKMSISFQKVQHVCGLFCTAQELFIVFYVCIFTRKSVGGVMHNSLYIISLLH